MKSDLVTLLALVVVAVATMVLRRRLIRPTTHGSAGWGRPAREFLCPPERGAVRIGYHRGKAVTLTREATLQHGMVIGGTGTGKSRCYFLPNAAALAGTSLICTDPKGELWRYTSGFHKEAVRFAPADPDASACFNWVPLCRDARLSELCARAIVECGNTGGAEQVWIDLETAFLSALFSHASTLSAPTPLTAYRLFTGQSQAELIEQLLQSESETAREQANIFLQTQERMRGSIVPVVAARLQWLRDDAVARFCSASLAAPDFGRLRERPAALYWCLREQDIARLRPLSSLFFSLLLEQISGSNDTPAVVPITMLLDEFANVGSIPNFETTISVVRGRGVALWLGIQSLSQLEARYGRSNSQTILSNCGAKIALHGLDVDTTKYLSSALGEGTATASRSSIQRLLGILPSPTVTVSEQHNARPLLTADEVRRISERSAITIVGNHRPMLLTKSYYKAAPMTKTEAGPPLGRPLTCIMPQQPSALPDFPEDLRTPLLAS